MGSIESEKLTAVLSGVSGEYYVAAELSRRGLIASISLRNTRGVDILVTNQELQSTLTIQVKTNQGSKREWLLSDKCEKTTSPTHFYVFVNLGGMNDRPKFFIVPSGDVASFSKRNHARWLKEPGKRGRDHNDNSMRKFIDTDGAYLERWDLLFACAERSDRFTWNVDEVEFRKSKKSDC